MLATAAPALAQVRIAQWNVTNYQSGRVADFQTAIYGSFSGRSMSPDLLMIEEVIEEINIAACGNVFNQQCCGNNSVANFLSILNTAPGSPGDWAAAAYVVNDGDTGNALFYRTSKFDLIDTLTLNANTGTGATQAPRDNQRWRVRLKNYTGAGAELYVYAGHFKAQGSGSEPRRLTEAQRIRTDTATLPAGAHFLLGGDFNSQSATESHQVELLAAGTGQLFDPINSPGTWNNSGTWRYIHTQDPAGAGGVDDRHDQILISATLRDSEGLSYIPAVSGGNILAAYSTTGWSDNNHSYRSWGNDGTSFNLTLTTTGNTMVGPTIAQALINSAVGGGHLPVILDLQVPPKVNTPAPIDFGVVTVGASATRTLTVTNSANLALWSKDGTGWGIDELTYTLAASSGFSAPAGTFTENAGGGSNNHTITMNTATPGCKTGTITINSDDPDVPARVVTVTGLVVSGVAPSPGAGDYDVNNDCLANIEDLYVWHAGNTDVNLDGSVTAADGTYLRDGLRSNETTDVRTGHP